MPSVYLSPSTQEFNQYFSGGNEEEYMNLLADIVEENLRRNGIDVVRNDRNKPLRDAIEESNNGNFDLHLALHSNASPEYLAGLLQGSDVYYYPTSKIGEDFAEILAKNIKKIYPDSRLVQTRSSTELGELKFTKTPAVLLETAYHDNPSDELWIKENLNEIGDVIGMSVADFFGLAYR